jgi:density-regulated protein DRP1
VKPAKKKKKVGIAVGEKPGAIKVYKTKRGAKKVICYVVGLHTYGINLKDIAKVMGKKFACGAAVSEEDKYGECIAVQGDIEERFEDFVDSDLAKYKVSIDNVEFIEEKKKKKQETE